MTVAALRRHLNEVEQIPDDRIAVATGDQRELDEVCELALAHVNNDRVEAAYRRADLFEKRRRLMADWAAYVTCQT